MRPRAAFADLGAREPFGAHAFHELFELVALGSRKVGAGGNHERLDDLGREIAAESAALELLGDLLKKRHSAAVVLDEQIGKVDVLHREAQIGLVVAVEPHRLLVGHLGKAPRRVELVQIDPERLFPDREDEPFDEPKDVALVHERHLDVDLGELELAIEPEVLVAKALHDLEVAVEPRHHEELLEELRALGKRIEFSLCEARGNQEVARAAGCVAHHVRRLELETALAGEVGARGEVDLAAQHERALQRRAPQIEVAVLEPNVFAGVDLVVDLERRRVALVEHRRFDHVDFNLAGSELRVLVVAARDDHAANAEHPLAASLVGQLVSGSYRGRIGRDGGGAGAFGGLRRVVGGIEDHLGDSVAVAQVDENAAAVVAARAYPAEQHDLRAYVGSA